VVLIAHELAIFESMQRSLLIAVLVLAATVLAFATAPYVTLTGILQGPNGLPVANDVISFTPTQAFFVAGTGQIAPVSAECATSIDGSVVGTINPVNPPQASAVYSGTLGAGNYYVEEAWIDASSNTTLVSAEVQIQLTGTGQIQELPPISGLPATVVSRNIYIGTTSGSETLQGSVSGSGTYVKSVPLVTGAAVPSTNTTVCQLVANDAGWPTGTGYMVTVTTIAGGTLPGYPMQWQLLGPGGTVNLSQGLPLYNGTVIYPSPILASPYNHSPQSINGPLNLNAYNVVNVGRLGIGTALPAYGVDVNGAVNVSSGYLYQGAAPVGHTLRGNGSFYVDSGGGPGVFNVGDITTGTTVQDFGDSFGFCFNVSPSSCWLSVFAVEKGFTPTISAVSSTGVADPGQFGVVAPLIQPAGGNYAYCCAINDMRNNLTSGQQGLWQQSYEALLWWLATPETNKVRSSSAAVTYTGTWSLPPNNYGGNMNSTTSSSATASFSVYGSDIVVIGAYQVGNSSTWNVTIDGAYTTPTITTSTNAFPTVAFNTNYGPNFIHLTGLVEQTHTVTFTCVSASSLNPCYFIAGGSSFGVGATGPFVYALETTKLVDSCGGGCGYNLTSVNCSAPCGSDALVAAFDMLEQQAINDLHNVGLNVLFVPLNTTYVPDLNVTTQADGVHPNNTGSTDIGNALIAAAKGYLTPMDRGASATFTNLNPCTANAGNGGLFAIGGLGVGGANACPPGMQRGDGAFSEFETSGKVFLGHDGNFVLSRTANSLFVSGVQICIGGSACINTGSGAPSGSLCGSVNTGSLYMRTDAPDASHALYVCQGSTWTAVTVP
jgi:hypothetical protein